MALHLPLFKALVAAIAPYLAMLVFEKLNSSKFSSSFGEFALWFLFGYFYTNFFEWWYHNYWLHKWRTPLRREHGYHHAKLHGKHFRTRDPERLKATTTSWYIFPSLFTAHYIGFISIFGHENAVAFFSGIVFHFTVCYELAHWLTHVSDNFVDERIISLIPIARGWRKKNIKHHEDHHAEYNINFNFSSPYAGDKIFRTKK